MSSFPQPWFGYREFRVQRRVVEDRDGGVHSLLLTPADGVRLPAFSPGQCLTVRVGPPPVAGAPADRWEQRYFISDRPRTGHYRISIKQVPKRPNGVDPLGEQGRPPPLGRVAVGAQLAVKAPSGAFRLIEDDETPVVLVAVGIGVAPMTSILNTLAHWCDPRPAQLIYEACLSGDHIMKDELELLRDTHPGFRLHVCHTAPLAGDRPDRDDQHRGAIDIGLLRRVMGDDRHRVYLCGPASMDTALVPELLACGVRDADIQIARVGADGTCLGPGRTSGCDPTPAPDRLA